MTKMAMSAGGAPLSMLIRIGCALYPNQGFGHYIDRRKRAACALGAAYAGAAALTGEHRLNRFDPYLQVELIRANDDLRLTREEIADALEYGLGM